MADKFQGETIPVEAGFLNYTLREPVGVVGQVVPWNFPLMFTSWKMAPALAAGNTIVMKPAEVTPLSSLKIAELMSEAGMPDGVVNIVPGLGTVAGQAIAEHPGIHKIAFTGSTATGREIVQASAGNLKKVQLELGGKGPNIVFDDANLVAAVNGSAWAIFHNQGQACIAGSRLILHEKIADAFLDKLHPRWRKSIRLGNPLDAATEMGPLTSKLHRDRVLNYVNVAREQGGEVLTGGQSPGGALAAGCYVEPTVVRAKTTQDRIAQEEVFGPFVTVLTFKTDDEALAIANGTDYGLGSGLWTMNLPARAPLRARAARRHGVDQLVQARQPWFAVRWHGRRAATAARWGSTRCASTRRSRACGSTSMRRFRRGIHVDALGMTLSLSCARSARRGGRCPVWAPTVAVGLAGRLHCASRSALARRNSLHSLRSLRSDNRRESDHEARAARVPSAPLRCWLRPTSAARLLPYAATSLSPPHKSPTPGTAHRAAALVVLDDACHGGAGKAVGGRALAGMVGAEQRSLTRGIATRLSAARRRACRGPSIGATRERRAGHARPRGGAALGRRAAQGIAAARPRRRRLSAGACPPAALLAQHWREGAVE